MGKNTVFAVFRVCDLTGSTELVTITSHYHIAKVMLSIHKVATLEDTLLDQPYEIYRVVLNGLQQELVLRVEEYDDNTTDTSHGTSTSIP